MTEEREGVGEPLASVLPAEDLRSVDNSASTGRFAHVREGGPVQAYLDGLTGGRQPVAGIELALARYFDREYFGQVGTVGHTQAIRRVSSELGAIVTHHASPERKKALLEELAVIRDAYDEEGRMPNADAPSVSSE